MIKKVFSVGLILSIVLLLNTNSITPLPIGKLLNPFSGYAALINSDQLPEGILLAPQLIDTVSVKWDELRIPHINAKNEKDLYFMQGYIMAFDRLWQMEFQSHAAAGRISEILGEKALDFDRFQRRIGMVYGAKNTIEEIKKNDSLYALLNAFSDGINHYISTIDENQYPIEYKILNYEPELWTPLKTSLLLKSMAWGLTNRITDLEYTKILNEFGIETINELFPEFSFNYDPIIPKNINFNFNSITTSNPDSIYVSKHYKTSSNNKNSSLGSNNWAINSNRTKNGFPILSNDPHLQLSLPSIWYLMHLKCPTINVMGVTIPGAPGIIIGFNDNISWGVTNGYDDSMDWYDIIFYNSRKNEYYYNNKWFLTDQVVEEIKIKNKKTFYDTIVYTHHGPVVWDYSYQGESLTPLDKRSGLAIQWLAHHPSNELLSFYSLSKASNYSEFKESLKFYNCPGQNFIYSDSYGNIGIFHSGKSPVRWKKQGMFISDGSNPKYDWEKYIPFSHRPSIKNPIKGYLNSANQHPVDQKYPYYLSEYFAPSYRATQINIQLDTLYDATIKDMINIQLDNTSLLAKNILPKLLSIIKHEDNEESNYWINILNNWNYKYNGESSAPTFFENWFDEIEKNTWQNDLGNINTEYIWPEINKLEELIVNNENSKWFDDKSTKNIIETFSDICNKSFNNTVTKLSQSFNADSTTLKWKNYRGTDIMHIAKIGPFSSLDLQTSGAENIINATRKTEGPSWRYIIEMSKPYNIKGIYPGGQSGYPGSKYYDNFVEDWVKGKYYDLIFPRNNNEFTGIELKCIPTK